MPSIPTWVMLNREKNCVIWCYMVGRQFLCSSSEPSKIELVRPPACRRYLPLGNAIVSIHSPHRVPSSTPAELTQKQHLQLVIRLPEPAQRIQDGRQNRLPCNVSDPIWGRVCKHGLFVIVCKSTRLVLDGFKATQMRRRVEEPPQGELTICCCVTSL
jgi:hypothetical protein